MESWLRLKSLWSEYHKASKIYCPFSEFTLLSAIGAAISQPTRSLRVKETHQLSYDDLLKVVGDVNPITNEKIPGIQCPALIYNGGETIDFRLHLFILAKTSTGKGRSLQPLLRLGERINVHSIMASAPTKAALTGRTERRRVGRDDVEFPITPLLLDADLLIVDECESIFKTYGNIGSGETMGTFRANMDELFSGATIHNSSASNTRVHRFFGRSTLVMASYPSPQILEEVKTGTLQRGVVISVTVDEDYINKIFDSKVDFDEVKTNEKESIDTTKKRLLNEISDIINTRVTLCRTDMVSRKKDFHYYLGYFVDAEAYKQFIEDMRKEIHQLSMTDEFDKHSFYIRALNQVVKMASIIAIINGRTVKAGKTEYEYAKKLFLENLQNSFDTLNIQTDSDGARERKADWADFNAVVFKLAKESGNISIDGKIENLVYADVITAMKEYWNCGRQQAILRVQRIVKVRKLIIRLAEGERRKKVLDM